jgi:hypothetical protein
MSDACRPPTSFTGIEEAAAILNGSLTRVEAGVGEGSRPPGPVCSRLKAWRGSLQAARVAWAVSACKLTSVS